MKLQALLDEDKLQTQERLTEQIGRKLTSFQAFTKDGEDSKVAKGYHMSSTRDGETKKPL